MSIDMTSIRGHVAKFQPTSSFISAHTGNFGYATIVPVKSGRNYFSEVYFHNTPDKQAATKTAAHRSKETYELQALIDGLKSINKNAFCRLCISKGGYVDKNKSMFAEVLKGNAVYSDLPDSELWRELAELRNREVETVNRYTGEVGKKSIQCQFQFITI